MYQTPQGMVYAAAGLPEGFQLFNMPQQTATSAASVNGGGQGELDTKPYVNIAEPFSFLLEDQTKILIHQNVLSISLIRCFPVCSQRWPASIHHHPCPGLTSNWTGKIHSHTVMQLKS